MVTDLVVCRLIALLFKTLPGCVSVVYLSGFSVSLSAAAPPPPTLQ